MSFNTTVIDAIKKRKSIRTFDKTPIDAETYEEIDRYLNTEENLTGPFGKKARLYLVPVKEGMTGKGQKIGTYGVIKNPSAFIAGVIEKDEKSFVEFGYVFEKLVLYLTQQNIGTCWLGGTFTRDSFEKEISFEENEAIVAVTPIGYVNENRSLVESTMRFMVKADNRKAWNELFFSGDFSKDLTERMAGKLAQPIEMVRLAPSASNKQPWRLVLADDEKICHFYLAHTPKYSDTMQRVDIGIAMCHFELSCKELGLNGNWVVNDPQITLPDENTEYIVSWIMA